MFSGTRLNRLKGSSQRIWDMLGSSMAWPYILYPFFVPWIERVSNHMFICSFSCVLPWPQCTWPGQFPCFEGQPAAWLESLSSATPRHRMPNGNIVFQHTASKVRHSKGRPTSTPHFAMVWMNLIYSVFHNQKSNHKSLWAGQPWVEGQAAAWLESLCRNTCAVYSAVLCFEATLWYGELKADQHPPLNLPWIEWILYTGSSCGVPWP